MLERKIRLEMNYVTAWERTREVHTCGSKEEARYLLDLVRALAPVEFSYRASYVISANLPIKLD